MSLQERAGGVPEFDPISKTIDAIGPLRVASVFWNKYDLTDKQAPELSRLQSAAFGVRAELDVADPTSDIIKTAQENKRIARGAYAHGKSISPGAKAEEE